MSILAVVSYDRLTKNTTIFEGPGTGIRSVYVESDQLPTDQDPVMAVVEFTLLGPEEISFVEFLDEHVEKHEDGRIAVVEFWDVWAARYGTDPREQVICGVSRHIAAKLFRARFGASEQTRARINGRVQRCWTGHRMIPADA